MSVNPVMKQLGCSDDDRVVIVHCDDVGMCHATIPAFKDLLEFGIVSSGATMVPCPWFPQVAAYCRDHPQADMGVHLTLNSEWDAYRWAPVSDVDATSGLIDTSGYFHRRSESVHEQGESSAVKTELQTQIDRALFAGIDVTHVDAHMFTLLHSKFVPIYVRLASHFRLPSLFFRAKKWVCREFEVDSKTLAVAARLAKHLEGQGKPLFDNLFMMPLTHAENRLELAMRAFDNLPKGLTHFIIHPAQDTPELRAMAPDWQCRVADYQTFHSRVLRDHIDECGIHIIGYRALRDHLRGTPD